MKVRALSAGLTIMCIIIAACVLGGCVQDTVVIKVDPNGSGIIEETILGNTMTEMDKDCGDECPPQEIMEKKMVEHMMELARKNVDLFGEGVRFVSARPAITTDGMAGCTAVYAFGDINTVTVGKDPMGRVMDGFLRTRGSDDEKIKFTLKRGQPAQLAISMYPEEWSKREIGDDERGRSDDDDDMKELDADMKKFLRGGRLRIIVEPKGVITSTNAVYRSGKQITLMDVSFSTFVDNAPLMKRLKTRPPRSIKEYKEMLKGIEGLSLELTNPVLIDFR